MMRVKYFATLALKGLLALASFSLASEGLRLRSGSSATKLSRVPLFGWVGEVDELDRLDGANFVAFVLTVALFWAWTAFFASYVMPDDQEEVGFGRERFQRAVVVGAVVLSCLDGLLFFYGIQDSSWGGSASVGPSLALTVGFEFLIAFVALMSVVMKQRLQNQKGESP
jgi:hypothetical protein